MKAEEEIGTDRHGGEGAELIREGEFASESPLSRSLTAYRKELPVLLEEHRGKWVAFGDGKRLHIADSQTELYRYCLLELGLTHDRFVVRRIIPESSPEIEFNLR